MVIRVSYHQRDSASPSFLGIYPAPAGQKASINHVCLGIERFDADAVLKTLTDRGITARIRQRGDTKELRRIVAEDREQLQGPLPAAHRRRDDTDQRGRAS